MRYRILESSEGYFFLQRRVWFWPWWWNVETVNEGGGVALVTFDSMAKAEDLIRHWNKRKTFKVVKEL